MKHEQGISLISGKNQLYTSQSTYNTELKISTFQVLLWAKKIVGKLGAGYWNVSACAPTAYGIHCIRRLHTQAPFCGFRSITPNLKCLAQIWVPVDTQKVEPYVKSTKGVPSSSSSAYNLPNSTACPGMPAAQQELQIHATFKNKINPYKSLGRQLFRMSDGLHKP
jgi:hypothetical protein